MIDYNNNYFKVLFVEMYANMVFVISCLYSAVSIENNVL